MRLRSSKLLAAILATAGALSIVPMPAGSEAGPVSLVGAFERIGPLYVDHVSRLLYQVSNPGSAPAVEIRDLDDFSVRRTVAFPIAPALPSTGEHLANRLAAVDVRSHRLFVPYHAPAAGAGDVPHMRIGVVDGSQGTVSSFALPSPEGSGAAGRAFGVEGLVYWPEDDVLYALRTPTTLTSVPPGPVYVQEIEPSAGNVKWSFRVPGCLGLPSDPNSILPFGRNGTDLYLACVAGSQQATLGSLVTFGTNLVQKVPLPDEGAPTDTQSFPVPVNANRGLFDPASGRVFLSNGQINTVFDGPNEVWVGVVSNAGTQLGINSRIGRFYQCTSDESGGLSITDAGILAPVPFSTAYPVVDCEPSAIGIQVDEERQRVFVGLSDGRWGVLQDDVPPFEENPQEDPDAGAENVKEQPGVTETVLAGHGASYGVRAVWVGGPLGASDNILPAVGQVMRQVTQGFGVDVAEAGRDIRVAEVANVKLAPEGVEALSTAGGRDDRTDSDLKELREWREEERERLAEESGCQDDPAGPMCLDTTTTPTWSYETTLCRAFGDTSDVLSAESPDDAFADGFSSASCKREPLHAQASARGPSHVTSGLVTVGGSTSDVTIERIQGKGIVATAKSVARNVEIGGSGEDAVVFIGEATATVTVRAGGHPGESGTTYERTFEGIKLLPPDGEPVKLCEETCVDEDLPLVVDAINEVIGPRIRVRLPNPDPALVKGTKMGTAASFEQLFWDHVEAQILFDKAATDLTMPALEVYLAANSQTNAGLVVQLAGVTATARYKIFRLPTIAPFEPPLPPELEEIPFDFVPPPPVEAPPDPTPGVVTMIERVRAGVRWVLGLGGGAPSVVAGWTLLLSPLYIWARRRTMVAGIQR